MNFINATIYAETQYSENNTIVGLDQNEKEHLKSILQKEDAKWGFHLERKYHFLNQYDNDDYVYVASLLRQVRGLHHLIYFNPFEKKWSAGYSEIPYMHLRFTENARYKLDENGRPVFGDDGLPVVDPKSFRIGVRPPCFNGSHILEFNHYWLQQYIRFLQKIFDDNEELVFEVPEKVICADGIERKVEDISVEYTTKEELLKDIEHFRKQREFAKVLPALEVYANTIIDGTKVQKPALFCWKKSPIEKTVKIMGWILFDEQRKIFSVDMKKKIYNTSGFAKKFKERNVLISEIFCNSLQMILAHETAHVANGHWNLRMKENQYSMQKDVMMVCELNADHTAIMWLLNELLFEEGKPESPFLAYKKSDLIHLWSIRIFSAYLALSWGYQDDERIWSAQTLEDFQRNHGATHPPYQFRVYNLLNEAFFHIEHICKESEMSMTTTGMLPLCTIDGHRLDSEVSAAVKKEVLNLVYSFEASFKESYATDVRDTEQKLDESLVVEKESRPKTAKEVPFLFAYMDKAKQELKRIEAKWPEVRGKLETVGTYRKLQERL